MPSPYETRIALLTLLLVTHAGSTAVAAGRSPSTLGVTMTSRAAIRSVQDIESVIVTCDGGMAYRLRRGQDASLLSRLYGALASARLVGRSLPTVVNDRMVLNLRSGKTVWLQYGVPREAPAAALISGSYVAPRLPAVLDDLAKNSGAALLDSRIGGLEVDWLDVRPKGAIASARVAPDSPQGAALLDKARSIIDWVDPRTANAACVKAADIGSAAAKFGQVTLFLRGKAPSFDLVVWDDAREPRFSLGEPLGTNVCARRITCDAIVVADYGNYSPPLVALRDMSRPNDYYLCRSLTRRSAERYGVEHLGLPGHPISDEGYYKRPSELYKELQGLVEAAYEAQTKGE